MKKVLLRGRREGKGQEEYSSRLSDQKRKRGFIWKNQKHVLTSLRQKSPADMLEYMISLMAEVVMQICI